MNFVEHQDQARRQTRRMLVMFALAVVGIVFVIDLVVIIGVGHGRASGGGIAFLSLVVACFVLAADLAPRDGGAGRRSPGWPG